MIQKNENNDEKKYKNNRIKKTILIKLFIILKKI
jgi:hypothetical protein